jgi:hypothetical protein
MRRFPRIRDKEAKHRNCPFCGEPYDPEQYEEIECRVCGKVGSTKCCLSAGRGCPCVQCEEGA